MDIHPIAPRRTAKGTAIPAMNHSQSAMPLFSFLGMVTRWVVDKFLRNETIKWLVWVWSTLD